VPVPDTIKSAMTAMVRRAQDNITRALEALEGPVEQGGARFREELWDHTASQDAGGGGWTRVLQDGRVFEKAGVNVSAVTGELSPDAVAAMGGGKSLPKDFPRTFFATGLSLVIHPKNPHAPTMHANVRYFERGDGSLPGSWWFGGGADLTPSYLYDEDARHFHAVYQAACDATDKGFYAAHKAWCDDYFLIKHRGERRGVGGIFFDDLHDRPAEELLAYIEAVAFGVVPSYVPLVERRKDLPFTEEEKRWQQLRRGRYVEFNLVYDRGTIFGLKTGGRVESILMSLPLTARWEADHAPSPGSREAELLDVLKTPRNWLG
jgi:coproporphyrinogen III oxidase